MNRKELAKEFIQTAAILLEDTSTGFAAKVLGIDENTYKPYRDLPKVTVKLAFMLADDFITESKLY